MLTRYRRWKIKKEGSQLEKLLAKYPDKPWNWIYVSHNPNLTIKSIQTHPNKPWNWKGISRCPNINTEFLNLI